MRRGPYVAALILCAMPLLAGKCVIVASSGGSAVKSRDCPDGQAAGEECPETSSSETALTSSDSQLGFGGGARTALAAPGRPAGLASAELSAESAELSAEYGAASSLEAPLALADARDGAAPAIPEPTACLLFAVGAAVLAARCRSASAIEGRRITQRS